MATRPAYERWLLGDQVQQFTTRRLAQLGGGGFVANVAIFDPGDRPAA
jgi:hypothetical protein